MATTVYERETSCADRRSLVRTLRWRSKGYCTNIRSREFELDYKKLSLRVYGILNDKNQPTIAIYSGNHPTCLMPLKQFLKDLSIFGRLKLPENTHSGCCSGVKTIVTRDTFDGKSNDKTLLA